MTCDTATIFTGAAPAAEPVIELLEAPESARAAGLVVRGAIASG